MNSTVIDIINWLPERDLKISLLSVKSNFCACNCTLELFSYENLIYQLKFKFNLSAKPLSKMQQSGKSYPFEGINFRKILNFSARYWINLFCIIFSAYVLIYFNFGSFYGTEIFMPNYHAIAFQGKQHNANT